MIIDKKVIQVIEESTLEHKIDVLNSIDMFCNSMDKVYDELQLMFFEETTDRDFDNASSYILQLKYIDKNISELKESLKDSRIIINKNQSIVENIVGDELDKLCASKCIELIHLGLLKENELLYLEDNNKKQVTTKLLKNGLVNVVGKSDWFTVNQWVNITLGDCVSDITKVFNLVYVLRDGKGVSLQSLL